MGALRLSRERGGGPGLSPSTARGFTRGQGRATSYFRAAPNQHCMRSDLDSKPPLARSRNRLFRFHLKVALTVAGLRFGAADAASTVLAPTRGAKPLAQLADVH